MTGIVTPPEAAFNPFGVPSATQTQLVSIQGVLQLVDVTPKTVWIDGSGNVLVDRSGNVLIKPYAGQNL